MAFAYLPVDQKLAATANDGCGLVAPHRTAPHSLLCRGGYRLSANKTNPKVVVSLVAFSPESAPSLLTEGMVPLPPPEQPPSRNPLDTQVKVYRAT